MTLTEKEQQIIDAAIPLFCKNGFHATGVDLIMKEAGVSKKTLYKYFPSKEKLIVAVLKTYDLIFRNNVRSAVQARSDDPREQLLSVFDVAREWIEGDEFYGCLFINAIGEHSAAESEIRDVCQYFKDQTYEFILSLCEESNLEDAEEVAEQAMVLLDGAIVRSQVCPMRKAAKSARGILEKLIA